MNSIDDKTRSDGRDVRKPYIAPRATRLSPDEAKALLLQSADINDPEVQYMLKRIEENRHRKNDS